MDPYERLVFRMDLYERLVLVFPYENPPAVIVYFRISVICNFVFVCRNTVKRALLYLYAGMYSYLT